MEHIKEIQSFMRLAEAQLHEAVKAYDMKQLEMAGNLIQEGRSSCCLLIMILLWKDFILLYWRNRNEWNRPTWFKQKRIG